jgi:hypothetical protein
MIGFYFMFQVHVANSNLISNWALEISLESFSLATLLVQTFLFKNHRLYLGFSLIPSFLLNFFGPTINPLLIFTLTTITLFA